MSHRFRRIVPTMSLVVASLVFPGPIGAQAPEVADETGGWEVRADEPGYRIVARPGLAIDAVRRQLDHAVERWGEYFDRPPSPVALVVMEDRSGMAEISPHLLSSVASGFTVMMWVTRGPGFGLEDQSHAAHEVCHLYLRSYVEERRETSGVTLPDSVTEGPVAYGARAVPDWFDEAVATLCEPGNLQEERRHFQFFRSWRAGQLIPLERLLTMDHPSYAGTLPMIQKLSRDSTIGGAASGSVAGDVKLPEGGLRMDGDLNDKQAFYPQVLVFVEWLIERAGPGVVQDLADAYAALQPIETVLRAHPELPSTVRELAAEWLAYASPW